MTALVAAELLKFRTTRAWIGFLLTLVALSGFASAGTVGSAPDSQLGTLDLSRDIVSSALVATIIAFVLGIVCVTSEWRHGTVARTYLATPRRELVLVAKELWMVLLAAALAVIALVIVLAVAVPWHLFEGSSFESDGGAGGLAGRAILATVLWGALGVGVGALLQNQTFALVGAILWILVIEALILVVLDLIGFEVVADYLPGRALSAFDGSEGGGLSTRVGGAVAVFWVVLFGVLGGFRMSRQDVT